MQKGPEISKNKTRKNIKEVEVHMSKYKEIIEGLKGEIGLLRNQLKLEQENKTFRDKQMNKQLLHPHIMEAKTENDDVLDFLQGWNSGENGQLHTSQIIDQINWISDISLINQGEDIQEDSNEINEDLEAVKKERFELEEKLKSGDISVWYAESSYFDKIRAQLYSNFEEEWDITHSIAEINELQKDNNERIMTLANEMEQLIEQRVN